MSDPVVRDFPNIEHLVAGLFAAELGGAGHVGSVTPEDLEQRLPFLRVVRTGGTRSHLFDYPVVELDLFDVDEQTGAPRASAIVNRLLSKPPPHPGLDAAACDPSFRELPWGDNENVRRWGATFYFETRQVRVVA